MSTSTAPAPGTGSRPGGRSARIRAAVHHAVSELVAAETAEPLTIPIVAARAGVHATTVYRRWGSVADLLADVAESRFSGGFVLPDTGDLRTDLERYTANVAKDLGDPDSLALIRATIGSGGEAGVAACRAERQEQLEAILERARRRGEAVPPLERTVDAIVAPLYYRAVFTELTLTPEWTRSLVEHLLPG